MQSVFVQASRGYTVRIGPGLLSRAGEWIAPLCPDGRAAIVTDDTVEALYAARLRAALQACALQSCTYVTPHGERSKNLDTFGALLRFFAQQGLTKGDIVLALGGGVPGDVAGFAAACYLRGIRYVQLPTTLLAAVDSSVGGKTAVNLPEGKNLAGAFYQPSLVLCDTDTLATLPAAVWQDGSSEVLKYGVLRDPALFAAAAAGARENSEEVIARCVRLKAALVAADEFDEGERRLLNLGHTFGHAIEAYSDYAVSHGRAVGLGMAMAARAAVRMGLGEASCAQAICDALRRNGLPTQCDFPPEALAHLAQGDKKRRGETITLVLPRRIGECFLHTVPVAELAAYFCAGV